jgi:3-dehydroquinate dehydratase II
VTEPTLHNRIEVMHGANLDQLGRRDPAIYGGLTLEQLEVKIADDARALGLTATFFQSNHEGEFIEHLHRLDGVADGLILNPGAWTHYAYAIRDALELAALPSVEVHLSDIHAREEFRHQSVLADLCVAQIAGRGPGGYRDALELLRTELSE